MSTIQLFNHDGFTFGIGDSNQDGKLDFDFGLRHEQWGSGPGGWGHNGAEIGFNTDRGLFLGTDHSRHNGVSSHGGYARVYGDGGVSAGNFYNDILGNHNQNHIATSPNHVFTHNSGGNYYSGNYWGQQSNSNAFFSTQDSWAGNSHTGAHIGHHSYGDFLGRRGGHSVISPGFPSFLPNHGHAHFNRCGCCCAQQFLCF